jgi:acetyltransferase-like isoleucine patch superfamily enzyme
MLPHHLSDKWKTWTGFYDLPADNWLAGAGMLTPDALRALRRRRLLFALIKALYAVVTLPIRAVLVPYVLVSLAFELERLHYFPLRKVSKGKGCVIDRQTWLTNGHNIRLGSHVKISAFSTVMAGMTARVDIGNNTIVGPGVLICALNHGHESIQIPTRLQRWEESAETSVVVGNNVWIGANAVILPGSAIGDGSIIGAGALVRGVIPRNSVYTNTSRPRVTPRAGVDARWPNGLAGQD